MLKLSQKSKLVSGTAALFLVGLLSMFFVVNTVVRNIIHDQLIESSLQEAHLYANKINNWFDMAYERVSLMATVFDTLSSEDYFEELALGFLTDHEVENVFVGFSDGRAINAVGWEAPAGWTSLARPWYIAAYEAGPGKITSIPPYISNARDAVSIALSTYLPDAANGIGAVIGTAIDLDYLYDLLMEQANDAAGSLFLIGNGGEIIVYPGVSVFDEAGQVNYIQDQELGGFFLEAVQSENEWLELYDGDRGHSYVIVTPIEAMGWYLLSVIPTDYMSEQVNYYTSFILQILMVVLFLLFMIVSTFIVKVSSGLEEKELVEERFKAMIEASPLAITVSDENYDFIDLNQRWRLLFNLSNMSDDVINVSHVNPTYQPCGALSSDLVAAHEAKLMKSNSVNFEWMHQTLDGKPLPTEITMTKTTIDGRLYRIAYIRDLRDEKEMIAHLEQATASAKAASSAKSAFLANMSHEIRTPMNAIMGMTAIGKRTDELKGKNYALDRIERASSHLLGIINDVLDMSKIEAGKFDFFIQKVEVEPMLRRALEITLGIMSNKWQKLTVSVDPQLPKYIFSDEAKLVQVLTNLLFNAVKFTPHEGAIHVDVRCLEEEGGLYTIQFQVIDSGIGIAPAYLNRLFEPFEQADSELSRKSEGTGLGLAISKKIVELAGGCIVVESELGEGTTFTFTVKVKGKGALVEPVLKGKRIRMLGKGEQVQYAANILQSAGGMVYFDGAGPFDFTFVNEGIKINPSGHVFGTVIPLLGFKEPGWVQGKFLEKPFLPSDLLELLKPKKVSSSVHRPTEAGLFKGYRALLAEDVELNQEIVASLLEETGLEIDFASNGQKALEAYAKAERDYDLILMDLHMPLMDGITATKKLRSFGAKLPIIALTANVFQTTIDECMAAGMDDYISKPLSMDALMEKLRLYLK